MKRRRGRGDGPAFDGSAECRFDGIDIVAVVHQLGDVGARQDQKITHVS